MEDALRVVREKKHAIKDEKYKECKELNRIFILLVVELAEKKMKKSL